ARRRQLANSTWHGLPTVCGSWRRRSHRRIGGRLLAHWLGVSVTALLLAEEIVSEDEATKSTTAEAAFATSGRDWDTVGGMKEGDFFAQGRSLVADGVDSGHITSEQAGELTAVLDRLEHERQKVATLGWQPGALQKAFPATPNAPSAARRAASF